MGLLQLMASATQDGSVNPAEAWLRARYPDLFRNGERLPPPLRMPSPQNPLPTGQELPPIPTSTPPIAPPTSAEMPESPPEIPAATGAPVGGAQDGPVAEQPAPRKRGGVLGALRSVFLPDAGSFMYGALNNPNGLWGARGAQQDYANQQAAARLANETAEQKLQQLRTKGEYMVVGNSVFHLKPDGTHEMISAPANTETMQLIQMLDETPPGPKRDAIERAIRGYQYTPEVIDRQANAKQRVQSSGIAQRGAEARRTKAMPGAGGSRPSGGGGGRGLRLPPGAVIIQ